MATTRNARAHWEGTLLEGQGTVELTSSGIGTYPITWASRAESADGRTSPKSSSPPRTRRASRWRSPTASRRAAIPRSRSHVGRSRLSARRRHHRIRITLSGEAENLDAEGFKAAAEDAKANCPVSKALAACRSR